MTKELFPVININLLGKCCNCGKLISSQTLPPGDTLPVAGVNFSLICCFCKKKIDRRSFGFVKIRDSWVRVRWVGEDGCWTYQKPLKRFLIDSGGLIIVIDPKEKTFN